MTKPDIKDVVVIVGLAGIGYGCWLIYPPIMFIVVGIFVFAIGFLGSK